MMNAPCYSNIGGGMCTYKSPRHNSVASTLDPARGDPDSLRMSSLGERELKELRRNSMRRSSQNPDNTDTVFINIGGIRFETYRATMKSLPTCKLANSAFMDRFYRQDKEEYFFDRDPDKFKVVLNYLRTGELHIPTNMCGPTLKYEFDFWGIDEGDIEMCCWPTYNTWHAQSKSLAQLESDMQITPPQDVKWALQTSTRWKRVQSLIWNVLHNPDSSVIAKIYAWISVLAVLTSVFSFCVETHPTFQVSSEEDIRAKIFTKHAISRQQLSPNSSYPHADHIVPHPAITVLDFSCLTFFTLEFFTRAAFSPSKLKFLVSPLNIIDFIAIMPDYVELLMLLVQNEDNSATSFVNFIFILRLMRICRIFRLIRHVPGLWILMYTLKASLKELLLMAVFLLIGMVIFASVIYYAEHDRDFTNIPIGFWWSVVTMTTVGYGDLYPKTGLGYLIGSVCAMMGLLMIAFTVPIIVGNFVLYYTHVQHGVSRRDKKLSRASLTQRYDWLFTQQDDTSCSVLNHTSHDQNVEQSQTATYNTADDAMSTQTEASRSDE